jgi:hypothetical protein
VHGYTGDLAVQHLTLARVESGAHVESELAHGVRDGTCATDCTRTAVEAGEEAIAGGVDLAAAEANQLSPHELVVPLENLAPRTVAQVGTRMAGSTLRTSIARFMRASACEPPGLRAFLKYVARASISSSLPLGQASRAPASSRCGRSFKLTVTFAIAWRVSASSFPHG